MKFKSLLLVLYILLCKELIGQSEAALPFLNFQQSTMLHGAGEIGVSVPSDLPSGFYYNPAILGFSSLRNHLSLFYSSGDLEPYFSRKSANTYGLNAGYNFKKNENDLPLSIGFGYIHNKFNYPFLNSDIENYDRFDGLSFGACYDYYLFFNIGFSAKFYTSVLSDYPTEDRISNARASGAAFDFGVLVTAPLFKLFIKEEDFLVSEKTYLKPLSNFSLGYSLSNIGNKVYYIDPAQADPLPRTARIGYTFDIGLELSSERTAINLINYSFTAEAEDLLIEKILIVTPYGSFLDTTYSSGYQDLFGDINMGKNLINLEGDNNVIIHKGHIIKLLSTVYYSSGRFGYNSPAIETEGIGISSEGFLKFLSYKINDETLKYISEHLIIDYYHATTGGNIFSARRTYPEISLNMSNVIF